MAYTTEQRINAKIPAPHLVEALDDDRDGVADDGLLAEIISAASNAVDALLSSQFEVPFTDPVPSKVSEAAFCFAGEMIYDRREILEKNPFRKDANFWRAELKLVGEGKKALDVETESGLAASYGSRTPIAMRTDTE